MWTKTLSQAKQPSSARDLSQIQDTQSTADNATGSGDSERPHSDPFPHLVCSNGIQQSCVSMSYLTAKIRLRLIRGSREARSGIVVRVPMALLQPCLNFLTACEKRRSGRLPRGRNHPPLTVLSRAHPPYRGGLAESIAHSASPYLRDRHIDLSKCIRFLDCLGQDLDQLVTDPGHVCS